MKKSLVMRKMCMLISTLGSVGLASSALASGFQLWEQDGASIGNYHAGRAAEANDASIGYYNPAGLIRIHNQQLVVGADPILTSFKYDGTIKVNTLGPTAFPIHDAQGGTFNTVPDLHYAAPLSDNLVFGISVAAPFGLKTDYGHDTFLRYAATLTSLRVSDISPSLGFAVNDKISVGAGLDFEHARTHINLVGTFLNPIEDTQSRNMLTSNAYGFHIGALYQWSDCTRAGLNFQSQVVHHLDGDSNFVGPLANNGLGGSQKSGKAKGDLVLPATTTLSMFHTINPIWDVMGTVIYTNWSSFEQLILENISGIQNHVSSTDITVVVPENYRNTWNVSFGTNYHVNDCLMFRGGLGYDETPANDHARNIQLPDQSRVVAAIGGHFQASKTLSFDLGWSHYFALGKADLNNVTQPVGDQVTVTNGDATDSADVYGFQVKWDIV